jgi:hypothetical protein
LFNSNFCSIQIFVGVHFGVRFGVGVGVGIGVGIGVGVGSFDLLVISTSVDLSEGRFIVGRYIGGRFIVHL